MIKLNMEQGSQEWHEKRLGIPTASQFDRILTPNKLTLSKSADKYMRELVAEYILGEPNDNFVSEPMQRGIDLELEAVKCYEFKQDVDTEKVGLCLRDDGLVGCSPDRLVGVGGGLEIKTPMAPTHIGYLIEPESLVEEYKGQVQGALYITDAGHWDMLSYNPKMQEVIIRVYRDEKYITALDEALDGFLERLGLAKDKLKALGITGFMERRLAEEAEVDEAFNENFGVSE